MSGKLVYLMIAAALLTALPGPARPQVPKLGPAKQPPAGSKIVPKLEPIADTKLLMEGLAHPNFRGLDRILAKKPTEEQAWTFARGQALLLAETANLLMLRPPRNQGQPAWFERAMELRTVSSQLGQTLSKHDYDAARSGLVSLANACNRCHQTFRINVEIAPFKEAAEP